MIFIFTFCIEMLTSCSYDERYQWMIYIFFLFIHSVAIILLWPPTKKQTILIKWSSNRRASNEIIFFCSQNYQCFVCAPLFQFSIKLFLNSRLRAGFLLKFIFTSNENFIEKQLSLEIDSRCDHNRQKERKTYIFSRISFYWLTSFGHFSFLFSSLTRHNYQSSFKKKCICTWVAISRANHFRFVYW